MALPKIKIPLFDVTIPSTKKKAKFRPFLVKEEKILLIAQQGGSKNEMVNALVQVVNNCLFFDDGTEVDPLKLTPFDLEYLFLKIRSKSVNNIVKLRYIDKEDEKEYPFEIALDEIKVVIPPNHTNKVKVNDEIGIVLKYPTVESLLKGETEISTGADLSTYIIRESIESIYDLDTVYPANESSKEELEEFIDSLNVKAFEQIQNFFETMPKLYHEIKYTNSKGTERKVVLSTLDDFFTLV